MSPVAITVNKTKTEAAPTSHERDNTNNKLRWAEELVEKHPAKKKVIKKEI
jgi:hypothetical protein